MEHSRFADATRIIRRLPGTEYTTAAPALVLISGLPGTGKSFLARKIAERLPSVIVESDSVRQALFPVPTYSGPESMWVHRVAHAVIERLLATGHRVIYDATNLIEWHRQKIYRLAEQQGARLVIVQAVAPDEIVRRRLQQRLESPGPGDISRADWQVFERLKKQIDPIGRPHFVVDTSRDVTPAVAKIVRAMR